MVEPINLNQVRKTKAKAAARTQAKVNRAKHGRTVGERKTAEIERQGLERVLDGARREPDET